MQFVYLLSWGVVCCSVGSTLFCECLLCASVQRPLVVQLLVTYCGVLAGDLLPLAGDLEALPPILPPLAEPLSCLPLAG